MNIRMKIPMICCSIIGTLKGKTCKQYTHTMEMISNRYVFNFNCLKDITYKQVTEISNVEFQNK